MLRPLLVHGGLDVALRDLLPFRTSHALHALETVRAGCPAPSRKAPGWELVVLDHGLVTAVSPYESNCLRLEKLLNRYAWKMVCLRMAANSQLG